ncbi:solute:sodium symporter family transporter [bacterium]|nr:solute:sodium symporter family transporter [bacterium]
MTLTIWDLLIIVAFFCVVWGFSLFKSRKEKTSEDYFLAGRGATWPFIGFSLLAANISSEQFVGMSGQGAGVSGLAIASYEWIASITLVFVAIFFLPRFLRAGIYTIPEYLEYRYNTTCRLIMSVFMLLMLVLVTTPSVVYSGGVAMQTFMGDVLKAREWTDPQILLLGIWLVGVAAMVYTVFGGLKAVIWADLFQGSALLLGGAVVLFFTLGKIGGWNAAMSHAFVQHRMHTMMPANHPYVPWTMILLGIWIPNFYYWGLNQYITQRTLAAQTLRQGQLGVIFAAGLKMLIPFVIVMPGIMAPILYPQLLEGPARDSIDNAYPTLIKGLIPAGVMGFVLAALAGAVVSSLASMLNSASTIFTMDVYRRLFHREASQRALVSLGRALTFAFLIIACLMAPMLADPKYGGVFTFIQEFQGMFTPGILAAFLFGFIVKRAPAAAAITGLIGAPALYSMMKWPPKLMLEAAYGAQGFDPNTMKAAEFFTKHNIDPGALNGFLGRLFDMAFLNRMSISFVIVLALMGLVTAMWPLKKPFVIPVNEKFDMRPAKSVVWLGSLVILVTLALYVYFW